jgi:multidrug efflux pump subunit AcrB
MKTLVEGAIKYRKITLFMVVVLAALGLFNYYNIPKYDSPQVSMPYAQITVIYPGAAAEDVERLVTKKLEDEAYELEGYDFMQTISMDSVSVMLLALKVDVDEEEVFGDLRRRMQRIQGELPGECLPIEVDTKLAETAGILISLSGQEYTYEALTDYAEMVERQLTEIDGIAMFKTIGDLKSDLVIEVDHQRLNYYRFSYNDIVETIQAQNLEIPSGKINDGETKINVKTKGTFTQVKDVENIIIDVSTKDGSTVRLKDVADIYFELDNSAQKIKDNGEPAILLAGYFKKNENIIIVGKSVEEKIEEIRGLLPPDIKFNQVSYQPKVVGAAVNDFVGNLLQGIVLVIIVVFVGMGLKNALVVSTAIPLSILLTFTIMRPFGIEVHMMSIAGLIIALGMLVDNAIVVSDAIQVKLDEGMNQLQACVNGVGEVAIPILTSTLTTVAVFMPLMLLNSVTGEFIFSIPAIVTIALLSSYGVALLVTPTMAYLFFKKSKPKKHGQKVQNFFNKLLAFSLKHRLLVAGLVAIIIVGTGYISKSIGLQFFPKANLDMVYINVKSDVDGDLDYTEALVDRVGDILSEESEVLNYTASIGNGIPRFFYAVPLTNPSKDFAQILVKLDLTAGGKVYDNNTAYVTYLQGIIDRKISGGKVTVMECEDGEPVAAPVVLRLSGEKLLELGQVSESVQVLLKDMAGVYNVSDNYQNYIYEYYVDVDVDKSSAFGLSKFDVQNEVSIALGGRQASVFRQDNEDHNIVVKSKIETKTALENLMVKSSITNKKVLLKDIAEVQLKPKMTIINRYKRNREVMVTAFVEPGYNSVEVQQTLNNEMADLKLGHPGVHFSFDGEEQAIEREFGAVGGLTIFAIAAIYVILMVQFYSFVTPWVIFVTIPLSALGSMIGLFVFGQPLSFTALLGIVSLFGIVVNNAIVLIDYINQELARGQAIDQACIEAVSKRLRPILLSTVTTLMGLVPMILSKSAMFMPMAIALMSGLLISTLLTLVLVPMVYSMTLKGMLKVKNIKMTAGHRKKEAKIF